MVQCASRNASRVRPFTPYSCCSWHCDATHLSQEASREKIRLGPRGHHGLRGLNQLFGERRPPWAKRSRSHHVGTASAARSLAALPALPSQPPSRLVSRRLSPPLLARSSPPLVWLAGRILPSRHRLSVRRASPLAKLPPSLLARSPSPLVAVRPGKYPGCRPCGRQPVERPERPSRLWPIFC